jgi:short-subunit dehydrogenase
MPDQERPQRWRVAWITGASSGIGLELAGKLAAMGVKVAATARSRERLAALAAAHANVSAFPADVTDTDAMRACAARIEAELGPIDLAIFSAGIFRTGPAPELAPETYFESLSVNYVGCLNGYFAVRDAMRARRAGHIVFVGSVAGYRGLPNQSPYAPTKAALLSLAESLKLDHEADGLSVSIVNPGFVETPMTADNRRPMPFIITAGDAADRILKGLAANKFEIVFPFLMMLSMKLLRRAPYSIYFTIARMIEARQAAGAEQKD